MCVWLTIGNACLGRCVGIEFHRRSESPGRELRGGSLPDPCYALVWPVDSRISPSNVALQPRRFRITSSADGCKRVLDGPSPAHESILSDPCLRKSTSLEICPPQLAFG